MRKEKIIVSKLPALEEAHQDLAFWDGTKRMYEVSFSSLSSCVLVAFDIGDDEKQQEEAMVVLYLRFERTALLAAALLVVVDTQMLMMRKTSRRKHLAQLQQNEDTICCSCCVVFDSRSSTVDAKEEAHWTKTTMHVSTRNRGTSSHDTFFTMLQLLTILSIHWLRRRITVKCAQNMRFSRRVTDLRDLDSFFKAENGRNVIHDTARRGVKEVMRINPARYISA